MHESKGSLVVVGTGIHAPAQVTIAASEAIRAADCVLYAVADPAAAAWLQTLNARARPLEYETRQRKRRAVYERMVETILGEVRQGARVCVAFYGHPGVFAYATHAAIRRARQEGFQANMLAGVSAEDCLIADIGMDPAALGCQSYEATDFLIRPRTFDSSTTLILWQVGMIGNLGFWRGSDRNVRGLEILVDVLERSYPPDHRVYVYEASTTDGVAARIDPALLHALPSVRLTECSTLFVPARKAAALDATMMDRLGISFD